MAWSDREQHRGEVSSGRSDERGLDPERPLLFVIDGSKALRKAIREVFGASAPVQRCRVHKQRNILEHPRVEGSERGVK